MPGEKKIGLRIQIKEHSKLVAAIIVGILAVFVAKEMGAFFKPEVIQGQWQLAFCVLCIAGVGLLELLSVHWEGKYAQQWQKWIMAALFLLMPTATLCMMEFLHGTFIYNWSPLTFFRNYIFILIIYFLFYAISGKMNWALMLSNTLCYIFGIANHYIMAFRGTPFIPIDLTTASTGMTVVDSYNFAPDNQVILSTTLFIFLFVLSHRIRVQQAVDKRVVLAVRIAGLLFTLIFCGLLFKTDWFAEHGMKPDFFNQARGYTNRGSLFQFVINTKYLTVEKPKDYSAEDTGVIIDDMVPEGVGKDAVPLKVRPNIICVMNETFSDLRVIGEFETNQDYMPYMRSLSENTIKGYLHAPVYGAGTANSEFEFLTGNSISFLPQGACAYESYVNGSQPSLVSSLNVLGYRTTAFHPYYGENWSRDEVYPLLGFHQFMDIGTILGEDIVEEYRLDKDFAKYAAAVRERYPDQDVFLRRYVSDAFDYFKVIEAYEQLRKESDQPFFMFNVTMQNHSGYQYPYGSFEPQVHLTGKMEGKYPKTDQYLSLLKESDDALKGLLDYYSKVDEPTIICMFGDHQPSIEREFYEEVYGKPLDQLDLEDEQKMYITPFMIWANYDIEEKTVDMISLNYLSSILMETADLPMTAYQKYLAELYKTLPIITTVGYQDHAGNWYRIADRESPYVALIENYRKVQYNNLLDRRHRVDHLFMLPSSIVG